MRRLTGVMVAVVALLAVAAVAMASKGPERIALPDGFRPEGVAAGKARSIYVGSIPTGRVLEIDTKTGRSSEAVPARADHAAIGLKYDKHNEWLFVAGGPTGKAFVYDAESGAELAAFQLTAPPAATFINDVVLTPEAAYFTDSRQPVLYAVARDLSGFEAIELPGFPMVAGNNLNGIAAVDKGETLIGVSAGKLYRIDPSDGSFLEIDLGGESVANGDGLLMLDKHTLLVVQNRLNRIAAVELGKEYASGEIVDTISHPDFDVPTTVARKRGELFLPNARFTTPPTPQTPYWVTRVDANR